MANLPPHRMTRGHPYRPLPEAAGGWYWFEVVSGLACDWVGRPWRQKKGYL